jgi:hypothetical protein
MCIAEGSPWKRLVSVCRGVWGLGDLWGRFPWFELLEKIVGRGRRVGGYSEARFCEAVQYVAASFSLR